MMLLCYCLALIVSLSLSPVRAEINHEESRNMLLAGQLEQFLKLTEAEKDFSLDKAKITLGEKNSQYYIMALISSGQSKKADKALSKALLKYPNSKVLKSIEKQFFFFKRDYKSVENFSVEEEAQLKLMDLFPNYLQLKHDKAEAKLISKLEAEINEEITKLSNILPYFPTKLEYLLELDLENPNSSYREEISKQALEIISTQRRELLPKTLDFYELANAYRALAIINYRKGEKQNSLKFYKLAALNMAKMRSFWLEEDVRVWRPLLKIEQRETEFSYVFLEWIMAQVEKYDKEYSLLLKELSN